jgi:protein TonB
MTPLHPSSPHRASQRLFLMMLGAALVVHVLAFTILALWPRPEVTNIPVRALTFKLGEAARVSSLPPPPPKPALPAPPPMPPAPVMRNEAAARPAIAPKPQQYVRERKPPNPAPASSETSEAAIEAIRSRYEQEISSWIQQHKYYPAHAGNREGRAIVRVRIDRAGVVRYYAIEVTSGVSALDQAALDMIRRANPVPAVPENYPAGTLVEFLIPINFKAPL